MVGVVVSDYVSDLSLILTIYVLFIFTFSALGLRIFGGFKTPMLLSFRSYGLSLWICNFGVVIICSCVGFSVGEITVRLFYCWD